MVQFYRAVDSLFGKEYLSMKQKLTFREYVYVARMLFGLFLGAGNLSFPVHMGQLAGSNTWSAIIGFLVTGVGLPTPELQEQAAQIIADNQLNVRQAEALCKKLAKQPARKLTPPTPQSTLPVEVEESLKQALGNEVRVAYHDGKGKLTVHFYSDEQLKAFANLLGQYQT